MFKNKATIFHKILLCIFMLLIPIITLYKFSNYTAVSVVSEEIHKSTFHRLDFLRQEVDNELEQITRDAVRLTQNQEVTSFAYQEGFEEYFDFIILKKNLQDQVALMSATMELDVKISIFFPKLEQVISSDYATQYDKNYLLESIYEMQKANITQEASDLNFYSIYPFGSSLNFDRTTIVVEVKCNVASLEDYLKTYNKNGQGEAFLYNYNSGYVISDSENKENIEQVAHILKSKEIGDSLQFDAKIGDVKNMVFCVKSRILDSYFVEYIPIEHMLSPINKSEKLFYISTAVLLVLVIAEALILYRNVQIPIGNINKSLRKMKEGKFSTRMQVPKIIDFKFVAEQFNAMAEQIQELVENVYQQQLISKDARLKQMQSQINPHFLYNCLFFIANMARLENSEAVEKMALNLGEYFKYITRLENSEACLDEEIKLLNNYLEIQRLRMPRIKYTIEIDEKLLKIRVPRLILQPLIENSVIHGLEPKAGSGDVEIIGRLLGKTVEFLIIDNGVGISDEKLLLLNEQLKGSIQEDMGYGVWNVHQRLVLRFGESADVTYSENEAGGITMRLTFQIDEYDIEG